MRDFGPWLCFLGCGGLVQLFFLFVLVRWYDALTGQIRIWRFRRGRAVVERVMLSSPGSAHRGLVRWMLVLEPGGPTAAILMARTSFGVVSRFHVVPLSAEGFQTLLRWARESEGEEGAPGASPRHA